MTFNLKTGDTTSIKNYQKGFCEVVKFINHLEINTLNLH